MWDFFVRIPWWAYLLIWVVSFSGWTTWYITKINCDIRRNKDAFGYKMDWRFFVMLFIGFAIISIIPVMNIAFLGVLLSGDGYEPVYRLFCERTRDKER